jgi:hypothetical protein
VVEMSESHEFMEVLRRALEARLKQGGMPPRLDLREGEEAIVRIVDVVDNPWRPQSKIYIAVNLEDGMQYRLPVNVGIQTILQEVNAKPGDYLLLRYLGSVTTKSGRNVRRWSVGYLTSEEAHKLLSEVQSKQSQVQEKKPEPKIEKVEKQHQVSEEELKKFIEGLISVYGSASVKDLDYYFNTVKKLGIAITPELLDRLGFKIQGDRVVRK